MVQMHKPVMLVLLETRMADHKKLAEEMHFDMLIQFPTMGLSRGIVMMWKADSVQIDEVSTTLQGVYAIVKILPSHIPRLFLAIYASNLLTDRKLLWEDLVVISRNFSGNWFVGGDFNEVLKARDKLEGNTINPNRSNLLWNYLNEYKLVDLGYKDSKYTWINKRYNNKSSLILEIIDRYFFNDFWISEYPEACVSHFPMIHYDNFSLLIMLKDEYVNTTNRPFRFECTWASHPFFPNLISEVFPPNSPLIQSTQLFKNISTQ